MELRCPECGCPLEADTEGWMRCQSHGGRYQILFSRPSAQVLSASAMGGSGKVVVTPASSPLAGPTSLSTPPPSKDPGSPPEDVAALLVHSPAPPAWLHVAAPPPSGGATGQSSPTGLRTAVSQDALAKVNPPVATATPSASVPFISGETCVRHPTSRAMHHCAVCQAPICVTCTFPQRDGTALCPTCAQAQRAKGPQGASLGASSSTALPAATPAEVSTATNAATAAPVSAPNPPSQLETPAAAPAAIPAAPAWGPRPTAQTLGTGPGSAMAGTRCVSHPESPAAYVCARCQTAICETCATESTNGTRLCPTCALESEPPLSQKQKSFLIASFFLAGVATLGLASAVLLTSGAQRNGSGASFFLLVMVPALAGLVLGATSMGKGVRNTVPAWWAMGWNGLIAGIFVVLKIILSFAGD